MINVLITISMITGIIASIVVVVLAIKIFLMEIRDYKEKQLMTWAKIEAERRREERRIRESSKEEGNRSKYTSS